MKIEKMMRIGYVLLMTGMAISALGGMAHAGEVCIPYTNICIPIYTPRRDPHIGAPEIDPNMAVTGVTMLVASVLVIFERRRRR
jgi:hypothetical protein